MFEVGLAKDTIDLCPLGVGMLGYGIYSQRVEGTIRPIHVRTFVVRNPQTRQLLAYVCAEICFITQALRSGVLESLSRHHPDLGFNEHNLMLTAIHTHSAPGGFSHHLIYNLTIPGYVPEVYQTLVDTIVNTIVTAHQTLAPGRMCIAQGDIPVSEDVAFNRSLKAYNLNPETEELRPEESAYGVNRTMTVLRFENKEHAPIGMFCWFGVHCTSFHSDNNFISPDNKGDASLKFEYRARREFNSNFIAGFSQATPGDVSPNFRWDPTRRLSAGPYDDDQNNSEFNGDIQYRHAWRLFSQAARQPLKSDTLLAGLRYEDHGAIKVNPQYADGRAGASTLPGTLGLSMIMGTAEGRGPLFYAAPLVKALNRLTGMVKFGYYKTTKRRKDKFHPILHSHGPKFSLLDLHKGTQGKALFLFKQGDPSIPGWVDPTVKRVRKLARIGGLGTLPWTPEILPIQLFILGNFALPALPGEPTTIAGYRLQSSLKERLSQVGVDTIAITGFANAYSGYITTHQEYAAQEYEGGNTLFGPWTLAGYQTRFDSLARLLCKSKQIALDDIGQNPQLASKSELHLQRFEGSTPK